MDIEKVILGGIAATCAGIGTYFFFRKKVEKCVTDADCGPGKTCVDGECKEGGTLDGIDSVDFTWEPVNPLIGDYVRFYSHIVATVPCLCTWDYGNGDTDSNVDCDAIVSSQFAEAKSYTVKLTVTPVDPAYKAKSVSHSVPIAAGGAPVADFSYSPVFLDPGDPVVFTNRSLNVSAEAQYYWDFGDGGTSTAKSPTHVYTYTGQFLVTLTVTDDGAQDAISATVAVTQPNMGILEGYAFCICDPGGGTYNEPSVAIEVFDLAGNKIGDALTDINGYWEIPMVPIGATYKVQARKASLQSGFIEKQVTVNSTPCQCVDFLFTANRALGEDCYEGC